MHPKDTKPDQVARTKLQMHLHKLCVLAKIRQVARTVVIWPKSDSESV